MRFRAAALLVPLIACSGEASLPAPTLPTTFAFVATALEGQPALPGATRIVDLDVKNDVSPVAIGGDDIDMLVASIQPLDLPQGMTPADLQFVSRTSANARRLMPLYAPHILDEPSPPDMPAELVPVGMDGTSRAFRRDKILEDLALVDPCIEPAVPIRVVTPFTSSEAINSLRTLSNGVTIAGLSLSGTVAYGRIMPGSETMEVVMVNTGTIALVEPGARIETFHLGVGETPDGMGPSELVSVIVDGFARRGQVYSYRGDRYVDDTPFDEPVRIAASLARARIDGVDSLCLMGGTQGSSRDAAMWCRPEAGGEWRLDARFNQKVRVSTLLNTGDAVIVTDAPGNIYRRNGPLDYTQISEFQPNAGCPTPCVSMFAAATSGNRAFVAGDDAQALIVDANGRDAIANSPRGLQEVLFADERSDKPETALQFISATIAPDGAIWVSDITPQLFRLTDDSVERVCLPKELADTPIASIEAHPDGRLILGMSPALLGFGSWQR